MEVINFSQNWNNKLNCKCFSTIRIFNPAIHTLGKHFLVHLKDAPIGTVQVIDVRKFYLNELTNEMALLDTAISRDECIRLIRSIYKQKSATIDQIPFVLLILKYANEQVKPQNLFENANQKMQIVAQN